MQTCAGIESGIEAAIHSMAEKFNQESTEALLLVDASNAFNSMNRKKALATVHSKCPQIYQYLLNTYQSHTHQYISGSKEGHFIWSEEGATQGDNCAMAFFALNTEPIISELHESCDTAQAWYADDCSSCGTIDNIKVWWEKLCEIGPQYGYLPNAIKTVLIVKEPSDLPKAKRIFSPLGVKVTCKGDRHLGAVIGTTEFREEYVKRKVECWVKDIEELAEIALEEPQIAFAAFIKGLSHRWTYVMRTIPDIEHMLVPLEEALSTILIPALLGRDISQLEREIIELPIRCGGLGIYNPVKSCKREYTSSKAVTQPLADLITNQEKDLECLDRSEVERIKIRLKAEKEDQYKNQFSELCKKIDPRTRRHIEQAKEKGASSWLNVLPLNTHGYILNKQDFRDSIKMRYGWYIEGMPTHCPCGKKNDVNHALDCKHGGYPIMRHNAIRDTEANFMRAAKCKNVQLEPKLLTVDARKFNRRTNTKPDARLDISAVGVYAQFEHSFYDVRVTNPNCDSNVYKPLTQIYDEQEQEKEKMYGQRVRESEKGIFTPLIFTTSGGMGPKCQALNKRLAELITEQRSEKYSNVMMHVRVRLRFALLRSTLIALRGIRGNMHKYKTECENLIEIDFNLIPKANSYECP